jgi:hypothetical protein
MRATNTKNLYVSDVLERRDTYGKYILFPGKDPLVALCGLALGAMPVAAGVVTDAHGCARRTRIHMSAQGSRAAPGKGIQCAQLPGVELARRSYPVPCTLQHMSHFQPGAHLALSIKLVQRRKGLHTAILSHVQVHQGGLNALVPKQIFDGHNVQAHL